MRELGEQFGVHESTVCALPQRRGITARFHNVLTAADELDVCRLYRAGQSLSQVAQRYGRSSTTIWRVLRRHGVERRASGDSRGLAST